MSELRSFSIDEAVGTLKDAIPGKNGFLGGTRIDDRARLRASGLPELTKVGRMKRDGTQATARSNRRRRANELQAAESDGAALDIVQPGFAQHRDDVEEIEAMMAMKVGYQPTPLPWSTTEVNDK